MSGEKGVKMRIHKKSSVKPVYKGHSGEHKNVPLNSSCPLYTG